MSGAVADGLPAEPVEGLTPERRRTARRSAAVLAVLGGASLAGVAFSPYLIGEAPLLLMALSPLGRHLVLAAPQVNPVAFTAVGVSRRFVFYLASFHFGRSLGPVGMAWLEARAARMAGVVRWVEAFFRRAPRVAVFLFPGPAMSSLAGIAGMSPRTFCLVVAAGLTLRMIGIVYVAELARDPIEWLLAWIDEYRFPATVVLVTAVVGSQLWRRLRGRRGVGSR